MRKGILIVIVIVGIIAAISISVWAYNENHYALLTHLDYTATVMEDGSGRVRIEEKLTYKVNALGESWYDLERELLAESIDGIKTDYIIESVVMVKSDGTRIPFNKASHRYTTDWDYDSRTPGLGPNHWYYATGLYSDNPFEGRYDALIFYIEPIRSGTIVFEIVYEKANAALRYGDCSELTLLLLDIYETKRIESVKGRIHFPNSIMPASENYSVYTYGTSAHTFPVEVSQPNAVKSKHTTFMIDLNANQLKFNNYLWDGNRHIEFALVAYGNDKDIFTKKAPVNSYSASNVLEQTFKEHNDYLAIPKSYVTVKLVLFAVCVAIGALLIALVIFFSFKTKNKYDIHPHNKHDFKSRGLLPRNKLDANFAAALVFCKHKLSDEVPDAYAAAMLGLVKKEYITMEKNYKNLDFSPENTIVKITGKYDPPPATNIPVFDDYESENQQPTIEAIAAPELTPIEMQVYSLFLRHASSGTINLKSFEMRVGADYDHTESFVRKTNESVKATGVTDGYFQKADYKQIKIKAAKRIIPFIVAGVGILCINLFFLFTPLNLLFGGLFVLGGAFAAAAFLSWFLYRNCVLLTKAGNDEYLTWRAFYNYLKNDDFSKKVKADDLNNLDDYLIYATAFGLSDNLAKALKVNFSAKFENTSSFNTPYYGYRRYSRRNRYSFRRAVRRATRISRRGLGNGFRSGGYRGFRGGG